MKAKNPVTEALRRKKISVENGLPDQHDLTATFDAEAKAIHLSVQDRQSGQTWRHTVRFTLPAPTKEFSYVGDSEFNGAESTLREDFIPTAVILDENCGIDDGTGNTSRLPVVYIDFDCRDPDVDSKCYGLVVNMKTAAPTLH